MRSTAANTAFRQDLPAAPPDVARLTVDVVVPVRNDARRLRQCLEALAKSTYPLGEVHVVDDFSADDPGAAAAALGIDTVRLGRLVGAAHARNIGAAAAASDLILFVDADVCVRPETIGFVVETFERRPDAAAVIGLYDDEPSCPSPTSRYRNLLIHYMQKGAPERGALFFTGCGAVRREAFERAGGFLAGHKLEDVEFGLRLARAGQLTVKDQRAYVKHLKCFTLLKTLRTDVVYRGVPWVRLILEQGALPRDQRVAPDQMLATVAVIVGAAATLGAAALHPLIGLGVLAAYATLAWQDYLGTERQVPTKRLTLALAAGFALAGVGLLSAYPVALAGPLACAALVVALNRGFYRLLLAKGGIGLAFFAFFAHVLYFGCIVASVLAGTIAHRAGRRWR